MLQPIRIGIVGGSISAGCCLDTYFDAPGNDSYPTASSYGGLLATTQLDSRRLIINNQAEGATGSSLASFCSVDWFDEPLDYLLIEFAANDASALARRAAAPGAAAAADEARAAMERLLRNWRLACRVHTSPATGPYAERHRA